MFGHSLLEGMRRTRSGANITLVPTRNGEAPLLAAQPQRWRSMKKLWMIVALNVLVAGCATEQGVHFQNHAFSIDLPPGWMQKTGGSAEQFIFENPQRAAYLTISYVHMNAAGRDLDEIANKVLEIRIEEDRKAASGRELVLGEPWRSNPEDGGVQINFFGHDSLGRRFFYTGFVVEDRVVNVTGELVNASEAQLHAFYKEVLSNFGY